MLINSHKANFANGSSGHAVTDKPIDCQRLFSTLICYIYDGSLHLSINRMEEIIAAVFEFIFATIESFFAEYTIMFLLVGLATLLLGVFIICFQIYTIIKGQKIDGTVIGAIKDVNIKIKNGNVIKKRLNYGTLFPIFEYTQADGTTHQDKGSSGGTHVYKYKTGQKVKLIIYSKDKYNYVSNAKSYFEYILGIVFAAIGMGIIYCYASFFASFNFSTFIWLSVIASLALKFKDGINKMIKEYRKNKDNKGKIFMLKRNFDPNHVRPIEEFVKEREQNRQKHRS